MRNSFLSTLGSTSGAAAGRCASLANLAAFGWAVVGLGVIGLAVIALAAPLAAAQTAQERGLQIAKDAEKANDGFVSESSTMEMVLINAQGDQTSRKMASRVAETSDDGDRSIITFQWPADVKGTKMLTWSGRDRSPGHLTSPRSACRVVCDVLECLIESVPQVGLREEFSPPVHDLQHA